MILNTLFGADMETHSEINSAVTNKTGYYVGIVSLIAWIIPLIGVPVSIIGLYLGNREIKRGENPLIRKGIMFSAIGLILSIINGAAGIFLNATGIL
jgi:hypothetical protein